MSSFPVVPGSALTKVLPEAPPNPKKRARHCGPQRVVSSSPRSWTPTPAESQGEPRDHL